MSLDSDRSGGMAQNLAEHRAIDVPPTNELVGVEAEHEVYKASCTFGHGLRLMCYHEGEVALLANGLLRTIDHGKGPQMIPFVVL